MRVFRLTPICEGNLCGAICVCLYANFILFNINNKFIYTLKSKVVLCLEVCTIQSLKRLAGPIQCHVSDRTLVV